MPSCLFWVQNGIWRLFGCWDISNTILGKFGKITQQPNILRGYCAFKTNGRILPFISNKDIGCRFKTSRVIKQLRWCILKIIDKNKLCMCNAPPSKMFQSFRNYFRCLQIPIFRNNFRFGGNVYTFRVQAI